MPTLIRSRTPVPAARLRLDLGPLVVVVVLSLMFAVAIWAALAPNPLPGSPVAAAQTGL